MKRQRIRSILAAIVMLIVIFDTKTATEGVRSGISVCLEAVIPSLFPFIILSKYLNAGMIGQRFRLISPFAKLCAIPDKLESILAIGLIGGYPVGAQAIADAHTKKHISRACGSRLLGFCNNAGPAFIFGMAAHLFQQGKLGWIAWLIQVLSALYVGIILPGTADVLEGEINQNSSSIITALETGVRSMAVICGWVILFRILVSYLDQYSVIQNPIIKSVIVGFLELSNGCLSLDNISSYSSRFILLNAMLSFGGICVWMQTGSAAKNLSQKWFYSGKILQCLFSMFVAAFLQPFLFEDETLQCRNVIMLCCLTFLIIETVLLKRKKVVALLDGILYNYGKKQEMGFEHVVPQEN